MVRPRSGVLFFEGKISVGLIQRNLKTESRGKGEGEEEVKEEERTWRKKRRVSEQKEKMKGNGATD